MKQILIILLGSVLLSGCVSVYRTPKNVNVATIRQQDKRDFDMNIFGNPYTCTSMQHLSFTKITEQQPITIPANKLFTFQASFTSIAGKCAPITISFTPKPRQAYVAHLSIDTKINKCKVTIYKELENKHVPIIIRKFKKTSFFTGQGKCIDKLAPPLLVSH